MAIVLLVLRTVHIRVIGRNDDQPCLHPGHRDVKESVGGHVEPNVFHHCHRAAASIGSSDGYVQGNLLIG